MHGDGKIIQAFFDNIKNLMSLNRSKTKLVKHQNMSWWELGNEVSYIYRFRVSDGKEDYSPALKTSDEMKKEIFSLFGFYGVEEAC